jgi:Immunity protein 50
MADHSPEAMPDWTDLLEDPRGIRAIFGDTCPSLDRVELHDIVLGRDGPTVTLRFDLPEFPLDPPTKWRHAGFNRVQVRLLAIGVRELNVSGLATEMVLNLEIVRDAGLARVHGATNRIVIDLAAEFLAVPDVSAYLDSPEIGK